METSQCTAYLGILEQENDLLGIYARSENGLLEVFFELLNPIVVCHVHASKHGPGHACGELSQRLPAASCSSTNEST